MTFRCVRATKASEDLGEIMRDVVARDETVFIQRGADRFTLPAA